MSTEALSDEMIERIAWYAAQASAPPVSVIQLPDDCDPVGWFQDALLQTSGNLPVYGVALGTPDECEETGAICTALTGNGLQGHANANFYMLCHTAVPLLIAEVRRLRQAVAAQRGGDTI